MCSNDMKLLVTSKYKNIQVIMDLKRLSSKEMHELKDKDRLIHWTIPFLKITKIVKILDKILNWRDLFEWPSVFFR